MRWKCDVIHLRFKLILYPTTMTSYSSFKRRNEIKFSYFHCQNDLLLASFNAQLNFFHFISDISHRSRFSVISRKIKSVWNLFTSRKIEIGGCFSERKDSKLFSFHMISHISSFLGIREAQGWLLFDIHRRFPHTEKEQKLLPISGEFLCLCVCRKEKNCYFMGINLLHTRILFNEDKVEDLPVSSRSSLLEEL